MVNVLYDFFSEISNIPLEHTPDPEPTVYVSEFLSFGGERGGLGYAKQGYVGGSLRLLTDIPLYLTQPMANLQAFWDDIFSRKTT